MNVDTFWKQCVEWLVEVGVLPSNHKTRYSDAVVFDLAQTLRDGVVLCNLLNALYPHVIDESQINLRAQMSEFLCMQNIRVVIYTLDSFFQIPHTELFSAQDLYQMTNFGQVLGALSYLSQLPICSSKYKPFIRQRSIHHQRRSAEEEEDIYRNLPDLAVERDLADEDDDLYDSVPEEKEEGIYGSLIDIKKVPSSSVAPVGDKRGCCIHEIVETENNYVQHLDMMVEQFMVPLRLCLPDQDMKAIFMNIEQLRPIHTLFFKELVKLQKDQMNAKFSQPFLEFKNKFLLYGDYCSDLVDAQDRLEECVKGSEQLRVKIEECQMNSSRNKFKLRELLCVPMQRILKYHLLVKELNKHTPEGHPDKHLLPKALTAMQELSQYINEVKRDSEELIKINQIESTLIEYDAAIPLREYGRVRKDGELKVKFDDKGLSSRNVFLFDKALFMTKLKNDNYILKDLLRLEDMKLDESPAVKSVKSERSWSLTSTKQGSRNYILSAKTNSDKEKWLEAFRTSFDNINPRALKGKKHNFEMHTFPEPTSCNHCDLLMKGIFYQGYQCSVTNARCHKSCLADTMKLIENNSLGSPKVGGGYGQEKPPPVPERGKKRVVNPPKPSTNLTAAPLNYKAHREYNGTPPPPYPNSPVITFQVGQPIEVTEQISSQWWKGKLLDHYDRVGYFPASYVSPVFNGYLSEKRSNAFFFAEHTQSQRAPRQNYLTSYPLKVTSPSHSPGAMGAPSPGGPIEDALWYAGVIDRLVAEKQLWDKPTGTFLIRKKEPQGLVISLKFNKDVKHIKIHQTEDNLHYVAECKNFRSVQELVKFYQNNSLSGFFLGLETTLRYPFRDPTMFPSSQLPPEPAHPRTPSFSPSIRHPMPPVQQNNGWPSDSSITVDGRRYEIIGQARALYDFEPRSPQELALQAGQVVNIISKAGSAHGWWKGEYGGRIGYFPTTFVEEPTL